MEALAPNILVQFFSLLHRGTSLHNTLSTCLQFVWLQSNVRQSLTGYIAAVAGTFESFVVIHVLISALYKLFVCMFTLLPSFFIFCAFSYLFTS